MEIKRTSSYPLPSLPSLVSSDLQQDSLQRLPDSPTESSGSKSISAQWMCSEKIKFTRNLHVFTCTSQIGSKSFLIRLDCKKCDTLFSRTLCKSYIYPALFLLRWPVACWCSERAGRQDYTAQHSTHCCRHQSINQSAIRGINPQLSITYIYWK